MPWLCGAPGGGLVPLGGFAVSAEDFYHCASMIDTEWSETIQRRTLCGASIEGLAWDFAEDFLEKERSAFLKKPRCQKCLEHEDMPLLLLGGLP